MNADAGPTAVAIVGIQGAMPQTFLARLLPLERPITRVPIPPSLRNIERLDTSLCQHTRGTSRDMGRRPCHAPRFTAGPRPDPKSTKLACMPRPTPGMHPHSHAIGRAASRPGTDTPGPGDRCRFAISHTSPRFYWVGLEASDGRLIWPDLLLATIRSDCRRTLQLLAEANCWWWLPVSRLSRWQYWHSRNQPAGEAELESECDCENPCKHDTD